MIPSLFIIGFVAGSPGHQASGPPTDPNDIPYQTVESGADSPMKKIGIFHIQSGAQLEDYLGKIHELNLKRPKVDWSKEELLAIQAKELSQEGASIKVGRVHRVGPKRVEIDVSVVRTPDVSSPYRPLNLIGTTDYPFTIIQIAKLTDRLDVRTVTSD